MSDKKPLFASLEDLATGDGVALPASLEGDAIAAKNAAPGLVAKDNLDKFVYLQTDSSGNLHVTLDSAGTCIGGHLTKTVGNTARTQVGADFSLTAGKALANIEWAMNCFRSTTYEIIIVDDPAGTPVETPIVDVICAEGDMQDTGKMTCLDDIDTTGMTDPVLRVYGTNLHVASDFRGRVTVQQAA